MSGEASTPEFSRVIRLDQIACAMTGEEITADASECAALARRFGLVSLDVLEAHYVLAEDSGGLIARGRLRATLSQPCVATGEPVPERIDTAFAIRFLPESAEPQGEEIELGEEDCDTVFYTGDSIDVGEAVAETLALSLAPYPRAPDADAYLKRMGVISEEQASPFAALLKLKSR